MNKNNTQNNKEIPNHVAIIPDGNRRWAKNRNLPTFEGHSKGFETAEKIIEKGRDMGIHTMTLWGFSTENWNRSKSEISYLMKIFERLVDQNLEQAQKSNARIIHLGRKDRIPEKLTTKLADAEEKTTKNTEHVLNIGIDYGGHDEILRATQKIVKDVQNGKISAEKITDVIGKYKGKYPYYLYKNYLDTKDQPHPYPDLVIRTSGEQRLSGYLSWQCAYAEFYFPEFHFPDFTPEKFEEAIGEYLKRDRRFGGNSIENKTIKK
jgi:undecaprenyl diphosphate synthase